MTWIDRLDEDARARLAPAQPNWVRPMLATLHDGPLPPGDWIYERKFDGQRVTAVCDGDKVRLVTRNGIDVTERYPDVVEHLPRDRSYVLDGEIVAFVDDRDSFSALQPRMHANRPDTRIPVYFLAFDLLHLDGQSLARLPLAQRRRTLEEIRLAGRAAVVPHTKGDPERLLARACEAGWEGLIAKRTDAPYANRRSRDWLKLKCLQTGEFVIGGYTAPQGSRTAFGALLVGEATPAGLRYVGKVGTGFDEERLRAVHEELQGLRQDENPFIEEPVHAATWVRPVLACRVDFTERTPDGRLRHPRFCGLRAYPLPGAPA